MSSLTIEGAVLLGVVLGTLGTLLLLFVACELVAMAAEARRAARGVREDATQPREEGP